MPRRHRLKYWSVAVMLAASLCMGYLTPANAADSSRILLAASVDSAAVGGELKVAIEGRQLRDVYAYEINLTYDSAKLRFESAVSEVSGGFTVAPIVSGNRLQLAHTGIGAKPGMNGDQSLFTLTFTGIAAGTADIGIADITLVDSGLHAAEADIGPATSVTVANGGTGGDGGGTGGIFVPSAPSAPVGMTDDGHGKFTVSLPTGVTEADIDMDRLGDDPGARLEIRSGELSMELPPELLQQLRARLSEERPGGGSLVVTMRPLSPADAASLIDRLQTSGHVGLKPSGGIYEIGLQLVAADWTIDLADLYKPITLRFAADPSLDAKLVSIYAIAPDETLEFKGGAYADGSLSADIDHLGLYAAFEYTKSFADVPDGYWAKAVITELAAKHIVAGTNATHFEPKSPVTRAEFAALLVRALHLTDKQELRFSDVSMTDWFYPEVSAAVKAGIVIGTGDTTFEPRKPVTREEMAAMLMRAYLRQHKDEPLLSGPAFNDEDAVSPWALPYVRGARALHLIEGRGADLFMPQDIGTRAEAAQILYNFLFR